MANYPQELAQDAVCQSRTGHMTGLWFLPARPLRLNTNEGIKHLHATCQRYRLMSPHELSFNNQDTIHQMGGERRVLGNIRKKRDINVISTVPYRKLRAGRSGIKSQLGRDFRLIQISPGAHPASCKMGTGSFLGLKCGRGVLLTTHSLLVSPSQKNRAVSLLTFWVTPGL